MEIKQELMSFISCNENNGALLLSGKWGCGKTYIIRQVAKEINDGQDRMVVIISLFGVDSIKTLTRKVKERIFYAKIGQEKMYGQKKGFSTFKSIATPILTLASEYSMLAKGINTAFSVDLYDIINVEKEVVCHRNGTTEKRQLVLVFDDLERSRIDNVELLGVINEYSENKGIKTILVADEEHITGSQYKEFKEKLISRTIKLRSDYSNIIKNIVNGYVETVAGYKAYLEKNLNLLILLFEESQQENLRAVKACIIDFERVYDAWKRSEVPQDVLPLAFYNFGTIHFENRTGRYTKDEKYGYSLVRSEMKKKYSWINEAYQLTTIEKWVVEGEWDEDSFVREIRLKFCPEDLPPYKEFLYMDFWGLNQKIVDAGCAEALQRAYKGMLSCDELIRLLNRLYTLGDLGVTLLERVDYSKMLSGFEARESLLQIGKTEEPPIHTFIPPDIVKKLNSDAQILYRKIEKIDDKRYAWQNRRDLISYLNSPETVNGYGLKYKYIIAFDDELLELFYESYVKRNNSVKRDLFHVLNGLDFTAKGISEKSDVDLTKANIERLIHKLNDLLEQEQDPFTKCIIRQTVENIPRILEKLS